MSELASPAATRLRQPRWLEPRLVAGILCIVVSVLLAAQVLGSADSSVRVWAVTRDLPRGTTLTEADLSKVRVRLFGSSAERYLSATEGASPVGRVLARDLGAGEMLPASALTATEARAPRRLVTVPVEREHALGGSLSRGDVVDIVATVRESGRTAVTTAVLKGVTVVDVVRPSGGFGGGSGEFAIVVSVAPADALRLTAAVQVADLDVIKVVEGDQHGDIGDGAVSSGTQPTPTRPTATASPR